MKYERPTLTYLGNLHTDPKCAHCGLPVVASEAVGINDLPYHGECFRAGLKRALEPLKAALLEAIAPRRPS